VRSAILGSGAGVHTVGVADDRLKIPDGVEVDGLIELMTLQPGVKSLRISQDATTTCWSTRSMRPMRATS
jgi:hypothetical protein